jgi:hypothetical protein
MAAVWKFSGEELSSQTTKRKSSSQEEREDLADTSLPSSIENQDLAQLACRAAPAGCRRRYEEALKLEGVEFQMPASFELKPGFRSSVSICAERGVSLECSLTFHFGQRFFNETIIDHLVYRNMGFRFESFLQLLYFRLHCVIRHDAGV